MATAANLARCLAACRSLHEALRRPCAVQDGAAHWGAFAAVVLRAGQWLGQWSRLAEHSPQDTPELAHITGMAYSADLRSL